MIREKAQAKLEGDQADAVGQIVQVPVTQEPTSNGEIAREDRLTELHVEVHIVEAEGFLSGWIAAGAHTVADVVVNKPRFDGVQIDQTDRLAAGLIDHHVVDLGVPMDGAVMEFTAAERCFQHIDALTTCLDERAGVTFGRPKAVCGFGDRIEVLEVGRRDVEILEGVRQLIDGQIADQVVEHSQPVAHFLGMGTVPDDIAGGCCADVRDRAPELSVLFDPGGGLSPTGNHPGHFPAPPLQLWGWRGETAFHVVAQGLQVLHHQVRPIEHVCVQALHDEGAVLSLVGHEERFVDVARTKGTDGFDPLTRMEAIGDGFQGLGHERSHGSHMAPCRSSGALPRSGVQNHSRLRHRAGFRSHP